MYERTPAELIVERSQDAEIVITNKTPLDEKSFSQLPKLKYIGVLATGYNIVDVGAAGKRGIIVTNIPSYGTNSVAQMTFALLLELCHHVKDHSDAVHNGEWANGRDFCFWKHPLIELHGKTIGIIGFGRIGQKVADIAAAFGMNVIGYDSSKSDQSRRENFKWAELEELQKKSDVVSLHCPLFPETENIINKETLRLMKNSAFLINTSRGPLVSVEDLAVAIDSGMIAGAALVVLPEEPPRHGNPIFAAKNRTITPHISWATKEARSRLMNMAIQNVIAYLAGAPKNVVEK